MPPEKTIIPGILYAEFGVNNSTNTYIMNITNGMVSVLFLLLFIAFACEKDETEYWGSVSTYKNGDIWGSQIKAAKSKFAESKFDLIIRVVDRQGIWLETLGFNKIPLAPGYYPLSYTFNQPPDDSLSGALYSNGYDDALFNLYKIAENDSTSYLEITDYNQDKAEIKGTFNMVLWRRKDLPGSLNAPDSIVFSDGTFQTRIND